MIIALLLYSLGAIGQDAKVIALTPEEARQAKFMQDQVDIAIKRQKDFYESLRHKYTQSMTMGCSLFQAYGVTNGGSIVVNGQGEIHGVDKDGKPIPPPPPCKKEPQYHDKSGWGDGFRYSEDFKYIVPVQQKPSVNECYPYARWICSGTGVVTTN
jgi:hypothetical protein